MIICSREECNYSDSTIKECCLVINIAKLTLKQDSKETFTKEKSWALGKLYGESMKNKPFGKSLLCVTQCDGRNVLCCSSVVRSLDDPVPVDQRF